MYEYTNIHTHMNVVVSAQKRGLVGGFTKLVAILLCFPFFAVLFAMLFACLVFFRLQRAAYACVVYCGKKPSSFLFCYSRIILTSFLVEVSFIFLSYLGLFCR